MTNALKISMYVNSIPMLLILISCQQANNPQPENEKKLYDKPLSKTPVLNMHDFSGNYFGTFNGTEIAMELVSKGESITGNLVMNGQQATISANSENLIFNGKIVENQSSKTYAIKAEWKQQKLHLFITFPEYNNQTAEIVMTKTAKTFAGTSSQQRNQQLVGTWRFTEVMSSGSGSSYMSFATDYFVKFNADGTFSSWTGKSAGGSANSSIEGSGGTNVNHLRWHTSGKELILVNPNSQQSERMNYFAENNRIMISTAKSKRVYQRVN